MDRFATTDGGTTWTPTILSASGKHIRPVSVRGHGAELPAMWLTGRYTTYTDFSVATVGARR
jgi:hypothetical protein